MRKLKNMAAAFVLVLLLPLNAFASELLVPVGRLVGLQLCDNTVTVAAYDDTLGTLAADAGLKVGDEILYVEETEVHSAQDVRDALAQCSGSVSLTIRRGSKQSEIKLTPALTDDGYRLGVYLRQGIAGVGTITWYDPDTGRFGALGHGVSNTGGTLLQMTEGSAYSASLVSVQKGKAGTPGLLRGEALTACGTLYRNTPQGVFGVTTENFGTQAVETAEREELHSGAAVIRTTVTDGEPQDYSVEILKVYPTTRTDGRDILLKVTDPTLLELTGGIVQGMSGSPILQDGKLVGAVTHVLVSDPTLGYGIYIGSMLDAAE